MTEEFVSIPPVMDELIQPIQFIVYNIVGTKFVLYKIAPNEYK